ncbi:hypothetical protein V1511DRAFT_260362 [Dipodascopsis uninucleata]
MSDPITNVSQAEFNCEGTDKEEFNRPLQQNCSVCFRSNPNYKCPACYIRYCSVACFCCHKSRTGCKGMSDVRDVVLKYIPRKDLTGDKSNIRRGQSESREESVGNESEIENEMNKRIKLNDRDYNFLSTLERRIGVRKNEGAELLRAASKARAKHYREVRVRGSRGRSSRGRHANQRGREQDDDQRTGDTTSEKSTVTEPKTDNKTVRAERTLFREEQLANFSSEDSSFLDSDESDSNSDSEKHPSILQTYKCSNNDLGLLPGEKKDKYISHEARNAENIDTDEDDDVDGDMPPEETSSKLVSYGTR